MIERLYQSGLDWKVMLIGIAIVFFCQFMMLQGAEPENGAVPRNGRLVLTLGFIVVAVSAYLFDLRLRIGPWSASSPRLFRFNTSGARKFIATAGAFAFAFLSLRLLGGSTAGSDIWIWLIAASGIGAIFAPSAARMTVGVRRARQTVRFIDLAIVMTLVTIVIGINASDLTDWYYSAIGDEYYFYSMPVEIIERGIERPFTQRGVDDYHPRLGMLMKSTVMQVVGVDHFGWKFSSILMYALAIPGIYLTGVLIGGRIAGAVAAAIFAFSHYLGGLAHIGYDHIDSLFPTVWAAAFFILAMRTKSILLFFVAGLLTGACLYTNVAARIVAPVIGVFAFWNLSFNQDRKILNWVIPCLVGAVVAAVPMLLVDGTELIDQMFGRVLGGQAEPSSLGLYDRIVRNFELNLFAFNYNVFSSHYISGSLMDPLTAATAIAATGFAVGRLRDPASAFLLIWLVLALMATGGISPYDWHTAVTRLFPLMIPLSLLIGLFIAQFVWPINVRLVVGGNGVFNEKAIIIIGLLLIGLITLTANYQRAKVETPAEFQLSPVATSIGAMQSEICDHAPMERLAFVSNGEHLIRLILDSYEPGSVQVHPHESSEVPGSPTFLNHSQALEQGIANPLVFGCIIFTHPWESEASQVLNDLRARNPKGVVTTFTDPSGKTNVLIFQPG